MKQNLLLLGAFFLTFGGMSAADGLTVNPVTGTDIAAAIAEAKAGKENVGNITVNLAQDGNYTLGASIETGAGLIINGNGATIDASALEAPFVLMSATPTVDVVNDYSRVDSVSISNVIVNGLKNSIFYDNDTKYCVVNFILDGVNLGLATTEVQNEALISFKSGGAKDFTVKNSTIHGNREVAKYFIRYNNNARLDRYGFDKDTEFQTMTYQNNTFYNLLKEDGQWGNYNGIAGQAYSKFDVQKNIWFDCGKDIIRRMAGGRFNGNNPMEFAYNTYFNDGVNLVASEASYDKSGLILATNPTFADAAKADFAVGAGTQQAQFATGASQWKVDYNAELAAPAVAINVAPEDGSELASAINTAKYAEMTEGKVVGDITVTLAENGNYKLTSSIEPGASLVVKGNGATIDASGLAAPFILMSKIPAVANINNFYRVGSINLSDVTVQNVANSIFFDNSTAYCVVDFTIDNSTLALVTTEVQNEALISFKNGGAKDFAVKNSTIYGNGEVAKYFIRYNNNARLDRYGFDKDTEFQTMTYLNNTFYNLLKEDGQWGNYNGIAGQAYSKFDVQKNIWFDCGKDIIRRMAGGRFNGNNPMEFAYNTYFEDGVSLAESEASYDKSETILNSNPEFADAAAGNFTIGAKTQQAEFQTGAPKWLVPYEGDASAIESIEAAEADAPAEYFNLQGVRVDNPSNGIFIRRQGSKVSKVVIK
ncbi:MAG: DUF5123 domain-containing protein [Duncaniella sp.]|nr:DUF5123 domain-containing protein [Duncaniella sp.]